MVASIEELAEVLTGGAEPGEWDAEPPMTSFDNVVLVAPSDDVELVTLIAVANEPARDRVRELLRGMQPPRIGVYPPWFTKSG